MTLLTQNQYICLCPNPSFASAYFSAGAWHHQPDLEQAILDLEWMQRAMARVELYINLLLMLLSLSFRHNDSISPYLINNKLKH